MDSANSATSVVTGSSSGSPPTPPPLLPGQHPRLHELAKGAEVDGIWIADLAVIRHLTGFTGSAGSLLFRPGHPSTLFIDSRYTLQAERQCPSLERVLVKKRNEDLFAGFKERGIQRLGLEAHAITVAQLEILKEKQPEIVPVPIKQDLAVLRSVKSAEELAALRAGIDIDDAALRAMLGQLRVGMTEKQLAWVLEREMRERGADAVSFELIVVGGPNTALVHGRPGTRPIQAGDFLLVDHGVTLNGWHTDRTDTFAVGFADDWQKAIYQVVEEAHDLALAAVRPGMKTGDLDKIARDHIASFGLGDYFGHSLGHGVGIRVHEWPAVAKDTETVLEEGMVITIEPGVYIPDWGGIRIEDMAVVGADGATLLTKPRPKGMAILPV